MNTSTGSAPSAAEINTATRPDRDRFVDFLRAASISVVVLGHWLLADVTWHNGDVSGRNALGVLPQIHILTWILQVMPLFFFAGGFANAVSLRAAKARGANDFYRRRFSRLLRPCVGFAAVWAGVAVVLMALGVSGARVHTLASTIAIPLWFLAVYSCLILVAPVMHRLHVRFGARVPLVLAVCALLVDIAHRSMGWTGSANFLFVWLLPHQIGFLYADGSLQRAGRRACALMAAGAFAVVVALTTSGFAPVSMVGVPGARISNNSPPSFALAMHCVSLIGFALLARPRLVGWLEHPSVWASIVRLNLVAMTLFLWHMTALIIGAYLLYPLRFPQPPAGSTLWWSLRPVWMAALLAILAVLVRSFARFETGVGARRRDRRAPRRRASAASR